MSKNSPTIIFMLLFIIWLSFGGGIAAFVMLLLEQSHEDEYLSDLRPTRTSWYESHNQILAWSSMIIQQDRMCQIHEKGWNRNQSPQDRQGTPDWLSSPWSTPPDAGQRDPFERSPPQNYVGRSHRQLERLHPLLGQTLFGLSLLTFNLLLLVF